MDNASSLSTCRLLEGGSVADCVVIVTGLLCCCVAVQLRKSAVHH